MTANKMVTGRAIAASPAEHLARLVVVSLTVGVSDWNVFPALSCCAPCYLRFLHRTILCTSVTSVVVSFSSYCAVQCLAQSGSDQ